ncbi:hypothetical protein EDB85DRAFT_2179681 [Lactarius pseudohatsudake]|nr:hypothetical protein EDB85DRAFT_2179681 [Lactarius pseudohatsudake]
MGGHWGGGQRPAVDGHSRGGPSEVTVAASAWQWKGLSMLVRDATGTRHVGVSPAAVACPPRLHQRDDRSPSVGTQATRGPTTPSPWPLCPTSAARTATSWASAEHVTCSSPSNLASPRCLRLSTRSPVPSKVGKSITLLVMSRKDRHDAKPPPRHANTTCKHCRHPTTPTATRKTVTMATATQDGDDGDVEDGDAEDDGNVEDGNVEDNDDGDTEDGEDGDAGVEAGTAAAGL